MKIGANHEKCLGKSFIHVYSASELAAFPLGGAQVIPESRKVTGFFTMPSGRKGPGAANQNHRPHAVLDPEVESASMHPVIC
jgi:hypothetical protein